LFRLWLLAFLILEAPLLMLLALQLALVATVWTIRATVAVARWATRRRP